MTPAPRRTELRRRQLRADDQVRTTEVSRRADGARVVVRGDQWRGRCVVRINGPQPTHAATVEVVTAAFQVVESLLFYGIATPRTERDFAPS